MTLFKPIAVLAAAALASSSIAMAGHDHNQTSVDSASFGNGLNTAGPANHKIVPSRIHARVGDVVDFGVAGFHFVHVFNPGVTAAQVRTYLLGLGCVVGAPPPLPGSPPGPCPGTVPSDPTLIAAGIPADTYYTGIGPFTGLPTPPPPLVTLPPGATQSAAANRDERVSFGKAGKYLVICNLTGRFLDEMYAYVEVEPADAD